MNRLKLDIQMFSDPYVDFKDYPDTTTPINASNLNKIQTDARDELIDRTTGDMVVNSIRTKNMFDKDSMIYSSRGFLVYDTNSTQIKDFGSYNTTYVLIIKLQEGKTYTISKRAGGRFRAGFTNTPTPALNVDNVITSRLANNDTGTSMTFTVPTGSQYFVCNFYSADQTADVNVGYKNMVNSIQIEEGEATAYTPHQNLNLETQSNFNYATVNSTYFSGGQVVWAKIGHIVLVEINNLQVSTAVPDHNSLVASGLPTCVSGMNFYVFQHTSTNKARLKIINSGNEGQIQTHYSGGMAVSSNQWYGVMWYITNE